MKPYLAILIDSYWETVTSKVLWALLIGWSLLLAGLAPFGYITESSYRIARGDVYNRVGLAQKLAKGLSPQGSPSQKAISNKLSPGLQKQLTAAAAVSDSPERNDRFAKISAREMVSELNVILNNRELYDPDSFPTAGNRQRLKPIVEKAASDRSEAEVETLNRTLLDVVYSADIASPRSEQLWIGYAGIKLGDALPYDRAKINLFVERVALEIIIRLGLSFVAVFVGLIVTSPMIPETFRSGSLHLLLSKPVSRPLIYLTKFFGGTLFVLVNIAFLLAGLFLLVGWRLGIWNSGLLLCIPLLLFVFVIFYSVSALVGLIWNNPIICVVVCIVFWVFCLIIGVLESSLRIPARWTPQIVRFMQVEEDVIAVTQAGGVKVWNEQFRVWQPAADVSEGASGRVLGPIYDAQRKRLIMRSDFLDGIGGYATRSRNFVNADLASESSPASTDSNAPVLETNAQESTVTDASNSKANQTEVSDPAGNENSSSESKSGSQSGSQAESRAESRAESQAESEAESRAEVSDALPAPKTAEEARRKPRWPTEKGIEPPMLMLDLITFGDKHLAISRNGIFEIDWRAQEAVDAAKSSVFGDVSSWLGQFQPRPFKDLTPVDYTFGENVRVTGTADQTTLFVYNNNQVDSLRFDKATNKFIVEQSLKLDGEEGQSGLIAVGKEHCVVAREKAPLVILPRDLSKVAATVAVPGDIDVRQLQTIGQSDRVSVVTHEGQWFVLNGADQSLARVDCPWQGSVTGVTWVTEEVAWVGIKPNRAAMFHVSTGQIERTLEPSLSRLDIFYRWIARPLYLLNPKPSSLNGVLQKLLSKEGAGQTQLFNNDLSAARVEVEIWQPILSNLAFVVVLLTVGCIYVWRKEF